MQTAMTPTSDTTQTPVSTSEESRLSESVPTQRARRESHPMQSFLSKTTHPIAQGDIVEGVVISTTRSSVFVDLKPTGTGIIYGREFLNARDIIKKIRLGDTITAKVVEVENEDGYVELSLKEARQALVWSEAEKLIADKHIVELVVKDANKGGLMLEWQGIPGFLPASQLKTEHYPRVEDGDKDKILEELKKLVGKPLSVVIINAQPEEGKLIFSEKDPQQPAKAKLIDNYAVGNLVEGEITGIVDFGVFVKIEEGLEGLAHISELDWGLVEDPRALFNVGEHVKAKIIEIKDDQISLSIKALKEDPWAKVAKEFKKGDVVDAVIIKHNRHGALASIAEGVAGLVHISEFESEEHLHQTLELGKTYKLHLNLFDAEKHKMTFSYKAVADAEKEKSASVS